MTYILDFDGVLFDDQRFKSDFGHVFSRYGVSHGVYEQTYRQAKEARKGMYQIDVHLALLHETNSRLDIKNIRRDLFTLASNSRTYIFTDAKKFLAAAQERGNMLFLLSTGDKIFQEAKIEASGIADFFAQIVIIKSSRKAPSLAGIKKQAGRGEVVFIDDKREVVEEIKKHNPDIRVVQMVRGSHVVKSEHADAYIKSFLEINVK